MDHLPGQVLTWWLKLIVLESAAGLLVLLLDQLVAGLPLGAVVGVLTSLVALGLPLAWVAWLLHREVPAHAVLVPTAAVLWAGLGAMPALIWLPWAGTRAVAHAVALVAASIPLAIARVRTGEASVRTTGAGFGLGHAGRVVAVGVFVVVPAVVAYVVLSIDAGLRWGSGDFVGLAPDGVQVAHRTYVRGDDEVHLVAMAHIGDEAVYQEIEAAIPEGAVVLAEGVTDSSHQLGGFSGYDGVARSLGLTQQPHDFGASRGEVVRADIDVSQFSPTTLELLDLVFGLYTAEGTEAQLAAWSRYQAALQAKPDVYLDAFLADVVDQRNAAALAALDASLDDHDVAVLPWGALHMKGLAEGVKARGFAETRVQWRTLVPWGG